MKRITALCLAGIMTFCFLTACGKSGESVPAESAPASGEAAAAAEESAPASGEAAPAAEESAPANDKSKIVIGTSGVCTDIAYSGVEALEEMGYEVEIIVFDDYFLPNQALVEGSIDANLYQHPPFLNMYNEEKGTDIIMLDPHLWGYWSGLYSTKADTIEDLPDGGKVGVAKDASNLDLDLKRIQEAGLIKLTDEEKELYDIADIVENPHNYEFTNVDGNKYENMDEYTFITGSSNTMASSGIDPTEHLLMKFQETELIHGMCVLPENKDAQWVKDLMSAYTSDKAKAAVPASAGFEPAF